MFLRASALSTSSNNKVSTMINRKGLRGQPCLIPVDALYTGESVPASDTKKSGSLYMDMIALTKGSGMPILCSEILSASWLTLSKACFQSMKNRWRGEAFCLNKSWSLLIICIGSLVDLAVRNPYCVFRNLLSTCCWILLRISLHTTYIRHPAGRLVYSSLEGRRLLS